jgi:hypothetical protein
VRRTATVWPVLLLAIAAACGPSGEGGFALGPLAVASVTPDTWLKGTRVGLEGTGFVPPGAGRLAVTLDGTAGGRRYAVRVDASPEGPTRASFAVTDALWAFLPADAGEWNGTLTLERGGDRVQSARATAGLAVRVVTRLSPSLSRLSPSSLAPGEPVDAAGAGFLLPGEGTTSVRLSGTLRREGDATPRAVEGIEVPLAVAARDRGVFVLTPDLLGLGPGTFEGEAAVVNRLQDEDVPGDAPTAVSWTMELPSVAAVGPARVRRGQEVVVTGRGFLPVDGDLGSATLLAFTGTRSGADGTTTFPANAPFVLVPDAVEGNTTARWVVRIGSESEGPAATFGRSPRTWEGTWTPFVSAGGRTVEGRGLQATLRVDRTRQVVWMRFLPDFDRALARFGLEAESAAVQARVLEVCRSDYAGLNVEFRDSPPEEWVEFAVVEMMGEDPNGALLLGLDNTEGKDEGNGRLDDRVGGYSAAAEAAGLYAYGGVFAASFAGFSPTLGGTESADPRFDAILGATAPELGGRSARDGESAAGGARGEAVALAVRTFGNLVADTVTHELGHSLGLAAVDGAVHDPGDNPGYIMDEGRYRPFAERAQLPGADPRVFAPYDRAYLESVLPPD